MVIFRAYEVTEVLDRIERQRRDRVTFGAIAGRHLPIACSIDGLATTAAARSRRIGAMSVSPFMPREGLRAFRLPTADCHRGPPELAALPSHSSHWLARLSICAIAEMASDFRDYQRWMADMLRVLGALCIFEAAVIAGSKLCNISPSWLLVLAPIWFPIIAYFVFAAASVTLVALAMSRCAERT